MGGYGLVEGSLGLVLQRHKQEFVVHPNPEPKPQPLQPTALWVGFSDTICCQGMCEW